MNINGKQFYSSLGTLTALIPANTLLQQETELECISALTLALVEGCTVVFQLIEESLANFRALKYMLNILLVQMFDVLTGFLLRGP